MMIPDQQDHRMGFWVSFLIVALIIFFVVAPIVSMCLHRSQILIGLYSASGLGVNSPVMCNGVMLGDVREVYLSDPLLQAKTPVVFRCRLKKTLEIPRDSQVRIITTGLMGDKAIDIVLGEEDLTLESGSILYGDRPFDWEDAFARLQDMTGRLQTMYTQFQNLKDDSDIQQGLEEGYQDLRDFLEEFNAMKRENAQDMAVIQASLDALMGADGFHLDDLSAKLSRVKSSLETMMNDNSADLKDVKANFDQASAKFSSFSKTLEDKGVLIVLKVPKEVKEARKSEQRKEREARRERLNR